MFEVAGGILGLVILYVALLFGGALLFWLFIRLRFLLIGLAVLAGGIYLAVTSYEHTGADAEVAGGIGLCMLPVGLIITLLGISAARHGE